MIDLPSGTYMKEAFALLGIEKTAAPVAASIPPAIREERLLFDDTLFVAYIVHWLSKLL